MNSTLFAPRHYKNEVKIYFNKCNSQFYFFILTINKYSVDKNTIVAQKIMRFYLLLSLLVTVVMVADTLPSASSHFIQNQTDFLTTNDSVTQKKSNQKIDLKSTLNVVLSNATQLRSTNSKAVAGNAKTRGLSKTVDFEWDLQASASHHHHKKEVRL